MISSSHVFFEIKPKGHYEINDNWGSHRDKRSIDKIKTHSGRADTHLIGNRAAHTK